MLRNSSSFELLRISPYVELIAALMAVGKQLVFTKQRAIVVLDGIGLDEGTSIAKNGRFSPLLQAEPRLCSSIS